MSVHSQTESYKLRCREVKAGRSLSEVADLSPDNYSRDRMMISAPAGSPSKQYLFSAATVTT